MFKSPSLLIDQVALNDHSMGECPACLRTGISSQLQLNEDDFWECSACHLQAHTLLPGMLGILDFQGTGDFRQNPARALSRHNRIVIRDNETFMQGKFTR